MHGVEEDWELEPEPEHEHEPEPEHEQEAPVDIGAVTSALSRLKSACTVEEFATAVRTLLTLVDNALCKGERPQYRRIRLDNEAFHSRLGGKAGGTDALRAFGFIDGFDAKQRPCLLFKRDTPAFRSAAEAALEQVRTVLPQADGAGVDGRPFANSGAAAAGTTGTTTFEGLGDLGEQLHRDGGMHEMMQQVQRTIVANPAAADEAMQLSLGLAEVSLCRPHL